MEKHKQRMEVETDEEKRSELALKMDSWKKALTQVADLKGKDAKDRKETEFIKEVVDDIHRRLRMPLSNTLPRLIGMDYHIRFISSWLTHGSCQTADILTIEGMSGIGKTSLARYVFGLHFSIFNKSSFIEGINVRRKENSSGLLDLQRQLCEDISKSKAHDVSGYTSKIQNALARKKVLIVLDDIGSLKQLDALLGNKGLHPGSKVIITTKDASLTERCALFKSRVHRNDEKVSLNGLYESASLELLCIHAFESQEPKEGFKEVSEKLVKYCDGHPLALEVLGRSLQDRDVAYWEECIEVLKKEPDSHINTALKMSFNALPFENDKELFKHIACFFVGMDRDVTETILNACGLYTRCGITNLIDKFLVRIKDNEVLMHQLVQEMGRDLIRQESPEKPWERSRLWCHEESLKVLEHKKRAENLVGLALDMRMLKKRNLCGSLQLDIDALSKMDNLKLLQLNYVKISGSYKDIPKQLKWLCMHGLHLKSIPLELPMENLVALDMSHSNIEKFGMSYSSSLPFVSRLKGLIGPRSKDKPVLGSLKILNLSFCEQLHYLGGFFQLPALERLMVRNCISLAEICESVEQCVELVYIDLRNCYNLRRIPISMGKLKKVETLLLDGCNSCESQIKTAPNDLNLTVFALLGSLKRLSLSNNNLHNESFPRDWSGLSMLEELCLDGNPIVSMPNCVRTLPRLQTLTMDDCQMLISIDHPPRTLTRLSILRLKKNTVNRIKFDREMSPLMLNTFWDSASPSSLEIDGIIKIQGMAGVEEKVLHSLGWTNLEFVKERRLITSTNGQRSIECETQMYYEFGVFSTFYEGEEMPEWITCRTEGPLIPFIILSSPDKLGPSIPFIILSSPNKLRGLNFCCILEKSGLDCVSVPMIQISNVTQNHTWSYKHFIKEVKFEGKCLCFLSHWMFGPNEMKAGDVIIITVFVEERGYNIKECGIGVVYDEDGKNEEEEEEEEDVLGYYKSWNHIIGGDLSLCQLTNGEYILSNREISWTFIQTLLHKIPSLELPFEVIEGLTSPFKAFSKKKKSLGS